MIKIRFHEKNATIRWKTPMERDFLRLQLAMFRDSMQHVTPISVKDEDGNLPSPPRPQPIQQPSISGDFNSTPDSQLVHVERP